MRFNQFALLHPILAGSFIAEPKHVPGHQVHVSAEPQIDCRRVKVAIQIGEESADLGPEPHCCVNYAEVLRLIRILCSPSVPCSFQRSLTLPRLASIASALMPPPNTFRSVGISPCL